MSSFLSRLLACTLLSVTCAGAAHATKLAIIGFQMSSETHARVVNAAKAKAESMGWDVQVLNSKGDMSTHINQLETVLLTQPDGIIIAMGKPLQSGDQYRKASEAGIPLVTVMSGTSPDALVDIAVNEYSAGAQAALYLLDHLNYRGNILTQRFEGNAGTRIRGKILDVVLSENPAVKVIGSHTMARTASWRDDVQAGMNALLLKNQGKVDGIWASFDAQAYIIDDILRQQGASKGKPVLVSIDGGAETYRRIADPASLLMATVMIPFEKMGEKAVDVIDSIAVGKASRDTVAHGPYIYMDAELVDASNVEQYVKKD
ncbi:sugar ABC transporter substrate-binding protein [Allopusillimonas soli]|uniref:Substrate-binding domain-containing protein n=1 Tax=Allopusillimonas soli TaxID=659016 RepID=A0A853FD17_9BURK|nr:substrate-binding domain-containing protein [Allopusillimonas soli]NYT37542.1 substrate-binding domain-containing protein [Allopusillimonas soli]TEA74488.1 sugar ABC transporter substrate-binding protein [Allopusillimonas soli]